MKITGVFEIKQRGRVITTRDCPRGVRMASLLTRGSETWQVTGIEMFNPIPTDGTVGLLIRGDGLIREGDELEHYDAWSMAAFTAHRTLTPESLKRVGRNVIGLAMLPNFEIGFVGGARGGDTEILRKLIGAREIQNGRPRSVVIVPDTMANQPTEAREVIPLADEVIELKNPITEDDKFNSYKIRNQRLVDNAEVLFAFFNGNYRSGTGHAIRMAQKAGIRIVIIPVA